jgi:hypothetical protein
MEMLCYYLLSNYFNRVVEAVEWNLSKVISRLSGVDRKYFINTTIDYAFR